MTHITYTSKVLTLLLTLFTLLLTLLTLLLTLPALLLILQVNAEELCAKCSETLHITTHITPITSHINSHITHITAHIAIKYRGAVCQAQRYSPYYFLQYFSHY